MRWLVDARLVEEARRHALRFACEDCAHRTDSAGCAHGYPADARPRREDLAAPGATMSFCKEFELGDGDGPA